MLTSLLIGTALVSSFQWLVWDGREDEAPPGAPPPSPFSSFANLRRHISRSALQEPATQEEEEDVELEPSPFPDYRMILERQKSFRVLKERKAKEAAAYPKNLTNLGSSSPRQQDEDFARKEVSTRNKVLSTLSSAKSVPSSSNQDSSTAGGGTNRQPSLTLSDASQCSSNPPASRSYRKTSSYPLTPEQSQILLPPVPGPNAAGLQILPAQTTNDAQDEFEEVDVVSSWLGSMEREGERVTCGASNCEGNSRKGGVCRCFEEGASEVRGRRLSAC